MRITIEAKRKSQIARGREARGKGGEEETGKSTRSVASGQSPQGIIWLYIFLQYTEMPLRSTFVTRKYTDCSSPWLVQYILYSNTKNTPAEQQSSRASLVWVRVELGNLYLHCTLLHTDERKRRQPQLNSAVSQSASQSQVGNLRTVHVLVSAPR